MAKRKKKNSLGLKIARLAKYILIFLVAVLAIGVAVLLGMTHMIPTLYLIVACVVLLLLVALTANLLWDERNRGPYWTGVILALLLTIVFSTGIGYARRGLAALNNITTPGTELAEVGVFVLREDSAVSVSELADDPFGILRELDREIADKTIEELENEINAALSISEYENPIGLIDALLTGEVRAVILNTEYLELVAELEGYEDIADRIRELTSVTVEIESSGTETGTDEVSSTVFSVFISGIDSRTGLTARSRSDTNIIATVNTETHQVLLVSTPRDYYVPLSISGGAKDKLTHAGIYGVQVSMDTLAMLYNVPIDYYFRVNFGGFEKIIDSLGGITVHSDYTFKSSLTGYQYVKGDNFLNGEQALYFARERKAFSAGDRQRGVNQMEVIKAVIAKLMSVEVLTNYASLMDAVEGSFETSLPSELIGELVKGQLSLGGGWEIITYSVSGSDANQVTWSQGARSYVMVPYDDQVATAHDLMASMRKGETITAP